MVQSVANVVWGVLSLTVTLAVASRAHAADLTAADIIQRATAHNAFGFADAEAELRISLKSKGGAERSREVRIQASAQGGSQRTLVRFLAPAEVAGTAYLVIENKDGDDAQYLYLPALAKTKRITGKQREQKFMGTDLTYADLQGKDLRNALLVRLADGDVGGTAAYVIEARPKDPLDSPYTKTVVWVHQQAFVPLKVEFYGKDDALVKVLSVRRLEKKADIWVATESLVKDLQTGSETRMQVTHIDVAKKFSSSDFDARALAGG